MKTTAEAYRIIRSTLMPSGDKVQLIARPIRRADENIYGPIEFYHSTIDAPQVGDRVIVSIELDIQHETKKS